MENERKGFFLLTYLSSLWVCLVFRLLKERLRKMAINSVSWRWQTGHKVAAGGTHCEDSAWAVINCIRRWRKTEGAKRGIDPVYYICGYRHLEQVACARQGFSLSIIHTASLYNFEQKSSWKQQYWQTLYGRVLLKAGISSQEQFKAYCSGSSHLSPFCWMTSRPK